MRNFTRFNLIAGFVIFAIAIIVYWLTMEPTLSFWDCGEFISAAFKMEVGHQPGAPLFLMIMKLFSLLAGNNTSKVAYWSNFVSVVSSAATVMFLFWSINAITLKFFKKDRELTIENALSIIGAGAVGALAYTFSDTFWFSAVEAEVYAISTLCTAIVFWAILRWEAQLNDRWLVFIAFIMGLSIGMHLLSLLTIPAISLVYYFRKTQKPTIFGTIKAFVIGCLLLGIVQFGAIQYYVLFAAKLDLLFVNYFNLGFGIGAIFFVLLTAAGLSYAIYYSIKKKRYQLNLGLLCLTFVLFGFSSYFMIIIRANAEPNINLSNPNTPMSLYGYLSREQYGDKPLLYGQTFDAQPIDYKQTGVRYRKGEKKYEAIGNNYSRIYDKNILFPRTYSNTPQHIQAYKSWMGLNDGETPSFWKNISFFANYQVGFMYWRYFAWNFIGRQNDEQGQGSNFEGNWISGIKSVDAVRLGNQDKLPDSITANAGYNTFYGLPFILGIIGLIYLYKKNKKDSLVVATLFFCTGIAIIIYINQDPLQVRERDYAYVGSFYTFAMVIGIGVFAVKDLLSRVTNKKMALTLATLGCTIVVPVLMAVEGWNDHNRSGKTTALEMAKNYLNSCEKNAILFTNADNDTYPLWYAQEVEGIRTDVRVICLQFLSSENYINQMKRQQNLSSPLPITMKENQYKEGTRDYLSYYDYGLKDSVELSDLLSVLTSDNKEDQLEMRDGSFENFLPTHKFKLTVNHEQVIANKTVPESQKKNIASQLEWDFKKDHILKSEITMLDIITHNNWKRPIYFSVGVSSDTYIGLDKYLYLEGFTYRLLPLKPSQDENANKTNLTNTQLAYQHYQNFELDGFKTAKYLDPESRRILQGTWTYANTLSSNLIQENEISKAKVTIKKSLTKLPLTNSSISDTLNKISLIQNLYAVKETDQAKNITKSTFSYISQELDYILSLTMEEQRLRINDIKAGFYVMQTLDQITGFYKETDFSKSLKNKMLMYETRFTKSLS